MITFKGNYMYHISGRAPKVSGNTLLHVVNNSFYDVFDHAFEIKEKVQVLAEGNIFQNIKPGTKGRLSLSLLLARLVSARLLSDGKTIASVATAQSAKNAMTKAGFDVA
ncbi:Pectin lyase B [Fusarium oxysporum f. sp. rapae]|uniref:Pectin lyase B n=1 Tax=Fusarium oxysporum f. sp. rapae TaxID=485398 RepID=A0A8J5NNE9_FUSOX|nr:Pectin lyase B [Fusarium oxysporum f. sp. rapae]